MLAGNGGGQGDADHVVRAERLGGVIRTTPFAGHPAIDEGADSFLARVPWAVDLARKVSLGDSLTSPATGKAAGVKAPLCANLAETVQVIGQARSLLADVAHELRTPLTIIEGTADAILDAGGERLRPILGKYLDPRP